MVDDNQSKYVPAVSPTMYKAVSQYRREQLEGEVHQGLLRDGSGRRSPNNELTPASYIVAGGDGMRKSAQMADLSVGTGTSTGANSFRGSAGNALFQTPEIYSPLWLTSNMNLPRDRATINAWCRSFYALNPVVQNAINLHSTYPISKLNIKCANKKVEKFFSDMNEELDLLNICTQVAQEYWLLGEAFVYAELDERNARWSRILIQNPDYIVVKRSVIAGEPIIMLRPDENLRRICMGSSPADLEQRRQLNDTIVQYVRRGQNIPLDNFYVSHLARKISPYEVRGSGLPISIFRSLMLFDQIYECKYAMTSDMINPMRIIKLGGGAGDYKASPADLDAWRQAWECHDEDTEVLTNQGFKKFDEAIEFTEKNGVISDIKPKSELKIACFNPENKQLEYHIPSKASLYNYDGEMYHFHNKKMDIKVTPNHDMYLSTKEAHYYGSSASQTEQWSPYRKVKAKDIKTGYWNRMQSQVSWEGIDIESVDVGNKTIPVELYLEYLGYLLSEGCLYTDHKNFYSVEYAQSLPKFYEEMKACAFKMASFLNKHCCETIRDYSNIPNWSNVANFKFHGKEIFEHFMQAIGDVNRNSKSPNKRMPRWILDLNPKLLKILLDALVKGDGSNYENKNDTHKFTYYTTSKQLADDVYEIVYKCGYVPLLATHQDEREDQERHLLYKISWSEHPTGYSPLLYKYSTDPRTKKKTSMIDKVPYKGKVWCFTVPTGLFITRRNGKITIQGNSASYDKNFKLFTHDAVSVETINVGAGIYDTSNDLDRLMKLMYAGLQVPQIVIEGGGDITYANGSISLDVLRQRYFQFRNMIASWLKRKIFQPIAKLNEFYDYIDGEKTLIIPEIEFNHMSLFDLADYVQSLKDLTGEQKRISLHTLYRSLGLDFEDERAKIRKEDITEAIRKKEQETLAKMTLNELRTLTEEDEIAEIAEPALPGMSPYDEGGGKGGSSELPGLSPPPEMPGGGSSPPPSPSAPAP